MQLPPVEALPANCTGPSLRLRMRSCAQGTVPRPEISGRKIRDRKTNDWKIQSFLPLRSERRCKWLGDISTSELCAGRCGRAWSQHSPG